MHALYNVAVTLTLMNCVYFYTCASEYDNFTRRKEVVEGWGGEQREFTTHTYIPVPSSPHDDRLLTEEQHKQEMRSEQALKLGIIRREYTTSDGTHVTFVDTRFQELAKKHPQAFASIKEELQAKEEKKRQKRDKIQRSNVYGDYNCRGKDPLVVENRWFFEALFQREKKRQTAESKSSEKTSSASSSPSSPAKDKPLRQKKRQVIPFASSSDEDVLDDNPAPQVPQTNKPRDTWCTRLCAWAYKKYD